MAKRVLELTTKEIAEYVGLAVHQFNLTEAVVGNAELILMRVTDEMLLELALANEQNIKCCYRWRGACGYEMRRRIHDRLHGQEVYAAECGCGLVDQMREYAKNIGVDYTTLTRDIAIFEMFFNRAPVLEIEPPAVPEARTHLVSDLLDAEVEELISSSQGMPHETVETRILPREAYVIAMRAPDPKAAIRIAENKWGTPGYGLKPFSLEVQALRESVGMKRNQKEKPKDCSQPCLISDCESQAITQEEERDRSSSANAITQEEVEKWQWVNVPLSVSEMAAMNRMVRSMNRAPRDVFKTLLCEADERPSDVEVIELHPDEVASIQAQIELYAIHQPKLHFPNVAAFLKYLIRVNRKRTNKWLPQE